ncbi:RNA polymerase sigma factor SigB [Alkalibacillus haloalkaliphilus]|uniref:RNA polymerase sigma factor SigB n=1 Tax=Alkalibacillus haloalkaliphilus TaxID=94136 RepID=UPI002935C24E|nr:RNA polymerase sigma factor SigB [Alkalibacillus haloalkaliphilus]MDV2583377.1 RNA polymerase sigma factor SigB [Alkalibacillus haloalkaliphilus]
MTTKSQQHNSGEDIYELIDYLRKHPESEETQEKIIYKYENLVHSLAKKYSKNSEIHEDLVQVGMLGLMAAIRRYDGSYGKSFESFAVPTIIGEIKRFIRDKTWSVHVPRRIKELGPKIKSAVEELTTENQRSPSVAEIADYLGASEEEVLETMEMSQSYNALSADRQIEADADGSTVTILDLVGDREEGYEQTDYKLLIEKIMPLLSEREQEILKCTYFENLSQKETGERLGLSQMHVSRLQRRALRKLRDSMGEEDLEVLF